MNLQFPDILLDSLENGHMIVNDNFIVTYWNRWLAINTQIAIEDIVGKSLEEFYPDLNYLILKRKIKTALKLKTPSFYDPNSNTKFIPINRHKVTTSSLSIMQQQVTISPYVIELNQVMISIYDISELHETKLLLQKEVGKVNELNEVLEEDKRVMDQNIMFLKTSTNGIILDASILFCTFFNYTKNELIGMNASKVVAKENEKSIYDRLDKIIINKQSWYGEIEIEIDNGISTWMEIKIVPISDSNNNIVEFNTYYNDITNKKLLEILSITDSLTKLYNRSFFDNLMSSITLHQRKADIDFALVMTDIDHFKKINDTYGHQIGDIALKEVSKVIKETLRENDVVARWGGEEFIIMIKNVTIDDAKIITEKLRSKIESKKINDSFYTTSSFGITMYKANESIETTFKRVDDALYEAKNNGRNRAVIK